MICLVASSYFSLKDGNFAQPRGIIFYSVYVLHNIMHNQVRVAEGRRSNALYEYLKVP